MSSDYSQTSIATSVASTNWVDTIVTLHEGSSRQMLSRIVFNNIVAFKKSSFIFNNIVALISSLLFIKGLVNAPLL